MKKYTTQILSLFLALTLSFSIYMIYDCFSTGFGVLLSIVTIATTLLYFLLCRLTERHRIIGGLLLGAALLGSLEIYRASVMQGFSVYKQTFIEWLLTKGSETEGTYYLWTLYIFFTTFFSITVYYFSNTLYRMFFLTLVSIIPAVLYLKVLAEMENIFVILTVLLNMAIFIAHKKSDSERGINPYFGNTLASGAVFVLLMVLLISFIPKNTETPYYDVFEDAFLGGDTSSPIGDGFSKLSSYSNDAGGFLGLFDSNRKLYTITCANMGGFSAYMKRQNFDYYDFKKDRWYADSLYQDARILPEDYTKSQRYVNLPALQSALLAAEKYEPGFLAKYGMEGMTTMHLTASVVNTLHITSENFGAIYYLAPTQCLSVTADREEPYYATAHGAFYSEETPHPANFIYSAGLYNDDDWRLFWLQRGGSSITMEKESQLLNDLTRIFTEHDDPLIDTANAFLKLHEAAIAYNERCQENNVLISPELKQLAQSLTAGSTYDYEKAMNLAAYFYNNDFVYDLTYDPRDDSPEYFLFTSKRGSCSDYASAYTLLARAAGLTVRYAEGYVIEKGSNSFTYVIKSRDSHAYPEVYIPNMGWVVYEPTVSRMESMEHHFSFLNFFTNLKMDYGLIAVAAVFVVIGMFFITAVRFLLPLILELIFRLRLQFSSSDRAALLAYNRIVRKASGAYVPEAPSKTPYELSGILQSIGCDMAALPFLAERVLYGNETLPSEEKSKILSVYRSVSMALFRYRHRKLFRRK